MSDGMVEISIGQYVFFLNPSFIAIQLEYNQAENMVDFVRIYQWPHLHLF